MEFIDGTIFEFIQYLSLLLFSGALYLTVKRTLINKQWLLDVPVILLLLHCIVFYIAVILVRLDVFNASPGFFTSWSTLRFFHVSATMLMIAAKNYFIEELKHGN